MQYGNTTDESHGNYGTWFFFILWYLFIDYCRPQDLLPIGFLKLGMFSILTLSWFLLTSGDLFRFAGSKQTRFIVAFTILLFLYVPFAKNNFFAYTTAKTMMLYLPFVYSVVIVVNSINRLAKLIDFIIITMCYVTIYCLTHNGKGSGNYFTDENDISLYINTVIPFCYFLFLYENNRIKKLFYGTSVLVGILGVVKSFSRGGFLGLVSMIVVAWFFSPRKILSIVIIGMLFASAYYYGGDRYTTEMATSTDAQHGTGKVRIESWKSGWRMFLDNPLGVGGNNFLSRFPEYQSDYFKKGMWGRAAHSLWFTLIPEVGVVGIYIYFALLYYNLKDIFWLKKMGVSCKDNRDCNYMYHLSLAYLASFVGFFVSASFISVLYYPHYWYLTAILVAARKISMDIKCLSINNHDFI